MDEVVIVAKESGRLARRHEALTLITEAIPAPLRWMLRMRAFFRDFCDRSMGACEIH